MSLVITVEIIECWKCGKKNAPVFNDDGSVTPKEKCTNKACRAYLDQARRRKAKIKKMQNLLHVSEDVIKETVKELIPKPEKPKFYFCSICELFFENQLGLEAHNRRRHEENQS